MYTRGPLATGLVLVVVLLTSATSAFAAAKPQTTAQRLAALEAQVATLTKTVDTLNGQVGTLESTITGQAAEIAALKANPALTLSWLPTYLSLDREAMNGVTGPNIVLQGANVHVRSARAEDDGSGLGNLIVGWNNLPAGATQETAADFRSGSNNLVCGDRNSFRESEYGSGYGNFVSGSNNCVTATFAAINGGLFNTVSYAGMEPWDPSGASISGGQHNTASGYASSISGGQYNATSGTRSAFESIVGGDHNVASGDMTTVIGGRGNGAHSGWYPIGSCSTVVGGADNFASGTSATVVGGVGNEVPDDSAGTIVGGSGNTTGLGVDLSSNAAVIVGGSDNAVSWNGSIFGGVRNIANSEWGTILGGSDNTTQGISAAHATITGGAGITLTSANAWAAGTPGDPAVAPFSEAWFLSQLITTTP